ncbi:carbohydrate ABC transporter permease [Vallitalea guaymasensis]|uniref:Carbohydrate ABC transporter permease n=1 Tax=Vallitalea guaymasensis TaxID=1185412 RepID=A0A8J8SBG7_9FIRM|nr:carbohydrate ABC transporter permease [Vallitalea guaymasensis]QUH28763.1 carbohydrate ABC transporter permease [Vallitalea guaymasensis]
MKRKNKYKFKRNLVEVLKIMFFLGITIVVFLPIMVTVFASFKTQFQIGSEFPLKPPTQFFLDNFKFVFEKGNVLTGLKNSLILVTVSVVVNAVLSTMIAYILSRFDFKLKKMYFLIFLMGMLVPSFVTEIARFGVISKVGLYNTLLAPIVIYIGTDLMQIYIYMQFMNQIPMSIDESAMIDGASYFTIYRKVIFPMVIPATATLGILKAVEVMNDMYIPYLYMPSESKRTLTTMLMSFASQRSGAWPQLSAAVIIVMIPTVTLYIVFQKYIFDGIVAGAVKE